MAILLVDDIKILDVDQECLKPLVGSHPHLDLPKEPMPVVELGQIVDALALAVEVQKKHRVGHGQKIAVEHDIREDPLHNNA